MIQLNRWKEYEVITGENPDVFKFIFKNDDAIAETVLYKYPTFEKRTVMCISTQTGCPMGCSFCGTGKFFGRNLHHEEIIEQVDVMIDHFGLDLNASERTQIMFMSMGEPLLNFYELEIAIRIFHRDFPKTALLVSSSGPMTKAWEDFMTLAGEIPTIGLQFSVHESTNGARDRLIPMKAKMCLQQIAFTGWEFMQTTRRKPFFNYCVHAENATDEDVERLFELFHPNVWEATLSVICTPDESAEAVKHNLDLINEFSGKLVAKGYNTRVFNPAGQDDIGGGCGQLWQVQAFAAEHPEMLRQSPGDKMRERA